MDASNGRFAYRCLPLLIANQHGWFLGSPAGFSAWWNGGSGLDDTVIRFDGAPDDRVTSHFGSGIITFTLSYLFRTPRGVNLLVKGPSNSIKDGVQALEAIVETDWAPAPFTMNWKLTRPNLRQVSCRANPAIRFTGPVPPGRLGLEDIIVWNGC